MSRILSVFAAITLLASSPAAYAKDDPLPEGIQIVGEDQAANCRFLDVVSKMRFAAFSSASSTQRKALIAALENARELGGNAAVITGTTAQNNQHQVTLSVYECSEASREDSEASFVNFNDRLAALFSDDSVDRPKSFAILSGGGVGTKWVATIHGYADNGRACDDIIARLNSGESAAPSFSCRLID